LAACISLAVAAVIEVDASRQASADVMATHRVTGLVCSLINLEALAAILKHLRHEGESVELSILIKCR